MVGRVGQVVKQTRMRIFAGDTKFAGKDRERVRAAHGNYSQRESEQAQRVWQAGQDPGAENQIVTHFEVYAERPADSTLLLPSIEVHQQRLGRIRVPWPPMRDFIRARTRKRDKRWECGGCRAQQENHK